MKKNLVLEETFEGGLKYSLYSNFKKWSEAFLELMDNAVSNRIPGKKLTVDINNSKKHLRIINRGGYGMGLKELRGAFHWGEIKERMSHDIGAYSQGGKSAMGYLGRSMIIITSPDKSREVYRIEDLDLHDFRLKKYNIITSSTDDVDGRVEIQVSELRRKIKDDELEELVFETYRPLIEDGSIEIFHNSKKIKTQPFPIDTEFKIEKFSFKTTKGKKKDNTVYGWIGRLIPRSGTKGGMRCYKLGRLICDREFFGPKDASYKQTLNFLFGEIHLDHIPATTNKTDFDRDSDEWNEVRQNMELILKPHIDELLGREIREPSDEEKERVKKVKDVVEELLKMKKIDFEGKSLGNTFSSGQKQRENKSDNELQKTTAPTRQNNPATPPPKDASGRRKRIKEFMEWELRDMDESVRSKIEESESKKKLVINNLFPGYKAAKANSLYMLETAAIQLSVPDEKEEKVTPAEYIEGFDELYAFFCSHLEEAEEKLRSKEK